MALGAGRFRIARQALIEVLLLAICGGAAGLAIAKAAVKALSIYGPPGKPAEFESPVFWFGAALTLATGIACGLYPAWSATRGSTMEALKQGGHQRTDGGGNRRWQQGLIVAQVAMATTLLLCGGLLLRSFVRLLEAPLGFNPHNVLTLGIQLPSKRYPSRESRASFYEQLFAQVRRIPGVESLSGGSPPFGYGEDVTLFEIVGRPKPRVASYADVNYIFPDYLKTLQIPLVRGQFFDGRERQGSQPVALIDDALAKQYFGEQNPIGQSITTPFGTYRVIGVVGSVKVSAIETEAPPTIYFSRLQYPATWVTLMIRSKLPLSAVTKDALTNDVQRLVTQLDKDEPVREVSLLDTFVDHSLKTRRFVVFLVAMFGVTGACFPPSDCTACFPTGSRCGAARSESGWRWEPPAARSPLWSAPADCAWSSPARCWDARALCPLTATSQASFMVYDSTTRSLGSLWRAASCWPERSRACCLPGTPLGRK